MKIIPISTVFEQYISEHVKPREDSETSRLLTGEPFTLVQTLGERYDPMAISRFPSQHPAMAAEHFGEPTPLAKMRVYDPAFLDHVIALNRARGKAAYVHDLKQDEAATAALYEQMAQASFEKREAFREARLDAHSDMIRYMDWAAREAIRSGWKYMRQMIMMGREAASQTESAIVAVLMQKAADGRKLPPPSASVEPVPQLQRLNPESMDRLREAIARAPANVAATIAAYATNTVARESTPSAPSTTMSILSAPESPAMAMVTMATMQSQATLMAAAPAAQAVSAFQAAVRPYVANEKQVDAIIGTIFAKTG